MSEQPPRLDLCCSLPADAQAVHADLFDLQPVADGVYAAIAAPQYKLNSNAAVILTNDGAIKVVGDLTEFCNAIREKGGEFSVEPYEFAPGTRIAYLAGPDGVSIELVESKAP